MRRLVVGIFIFIALTNVINAQLKVDANGNVGIGTASPMAKLNVNHWMVLNPHDSTNYEGGHLWLLGCPGYNAWSVDVTQDLFRIYSASGFGQIGTPRMVINSNGNMGIGTSTPNYRLDINGDTRMRILKLTAEDTTYEGGHIFLDGSKSIYKSWCIDVYQNRFRIFNPGFEKFSIDTCGNVGIGNIVPAVNTKLAIKDGHLQSIQTTKPTATYTSPLTGVTVTNGSTDTKGNITTTGTINSGNVATVTISYNKTYTTAPVVIVTATNASGSRISFFVTSSTTSCIITLGNYSSSYQSTPSFNYMVME